MCRSMWGKARLPPKPPLRPRSTTIWTLCGVCRTIRGVPSRASQLTYDAIYDELGAIGTPQQVTARLEWFRELYHPQEFMCWFNIGGMLTNDEVGRSMRLFAAEVMPRLRAK